MCWRSIRLKGAETINIAQNAVPIDCDLPRQHSCFSPPHQWTDLNCTLAVLVGGAASQGCIVQLHVGRDAGSACSFQHLHTGRDAEPHRQWAAAGSLRAAVGSGRESAGSSGCCMMHQSRGMRGMPAAAAAVLRQRESKQPGSFQESFPSGPRPSHLHTREDAERRRGGAASGARHWHLWSSTWRLPHA